MFNFLKFFGKGMLIVVVIMVLFTAYVRSDIGIRPFFNVDLYIEDKDPEAPYTHPKYLAHIPIVQIGNNGQSYFYGKNLQSLIQETSKTLHKDIFKNDTLIGFFYETWMIYQARKLNKYIPEKYQEEMELIAQGAQVSYMDILLINVFDDLNHISGCSSLAILKNNINTHLLHGRNLDYSISFLSKYNVITEFQTPIKVTSVAFPGFIGAVTATNEHGITLSNHTILIQDTRIGIPSGILYRMILDEAQSIADVERILKSSPRTIGHNLLVSSEKENRAVIFEITPEKVTIHEQGDFAACTNHFTSDDRSSESKITPNSQKRFNFLQNTQKNTQKTDLLTMQKILSSFDGNKQGWSSVSNVGTVQSVIFQPDMKTLWIAVGVTAPVTQGGYLQYQYGN